MKNGSVKVGKTVIDRGAFIASAAATVAAAAVAPASASLATPALAATAPALHLYEIGSWAWVFARSEEAARAAFIASRDEDDEDDVPDIRQLADDEQFTMMFADEGFMPDGVTCDVECTCATDDPDRFKDWGCECEAGDNPVTLSVSEWAALTTVPDFMDEGQVFREYEP